MAILRTHYLLSFSFAFVFVVILAQFFNTVLPKLAQSQKLVPNHEYKFTY
ncbi:hypothetical protein [Moraxella lacunata]